MNGKNITGIIIGLKGNPKKRYSNHKIKIKWDFDNSLERINLFENNIYPSLKINDRFKLTCHDNLTDYYLIPISLMDFEEYEIKIFKEKKLNDFLSLKLIGNSFVKETHLFIKGEYFNRCVQAVVNFDLNKEKDKKKIEQIEYINQILDDNINFIEQAKSLIDPETEFFAHSSNLEAWILHGYSTKILDYNLSFSIIKKLVKLGDIQAKKVFKDEIINAFDKNYTTMIQYLMKENYLKVFSQEELSFLSEMCKNRLFKLVLDNYYYLDKRKFIHDYYIQSNYIDIRDYFRITYLIGRPPKFSILKELNLKDFTFVNIEELSLYFYIFEEKYLFIIFKEDLLIIKKILKLEKDFEFQINLIKKSFSYLRKQKLFSITIKPYVIDFDLSYLKLKKSNSYFSTIRESLSSNNWSFSYENETSELTGLLGFLKIFKIEKGINEFRGIKKNE